MSTSTTKRRNTAQDHATLRLHLDGTRVDLHSPQRSNLHHSRKYNAGRDARGNRVARDAAGLGVVPKRPAPLKNSPIETTSSEPEVSADEVRSVKPRRRKRRRLNHDVEFLKDPSNISVPSSDLLKCVNYFACQYYAARGLLLDRSRMHDRKKEQRKAKDRQKVRTSGSEEDLFVADGEDDGDATTEDLREGDCPEGEEVGASSKGLPGMYKALDGSALVAIGMLLQELVFTLLKPNVPPGWEKEMKAAGLVSSNESIGSGNERAEETQSDNSEDEETWDEPKL